MNEFPWEHFYAFLGVLEVDTKEVGRICLGENIRGSQRVMLQEMRRGMEDGVREFVTLKSRQLGISTMSLAFDMFFGFNYPGLGGTIVTHDEPARDKFRAILQTYYDELPEEWTQEVKQHNRNQIVFENRTIFEYKVAGTRETSKKTLGRSSALTFAHMTECAFWGDPSQVQSLQDCFAQKNPIRWYHWESTANGFNHFHDMWKDAQTAASQRPIFITWWMDEFQRLDRDSREFDQYFGPKGRLTGAERDAIRAIRAEYDYELQPEQIAWYRWYLSEKKSGDEGAMKAEHPNLPEDAFVASGSNFFSSEALTNGYRRISKFDKPMTLHLNFGDEFTDTVAVECRPHVAQLRVYEPPVAGAEYAIGVDPAWGRDGKGDNHAINVFRCWANKLIQVAEFQDRRINTRQVAWAFMYLGGCYQPCVYNIEANGPGNAVLLEIDRLRRLSGYSYRRSESRTMLDVVQKIREFYYTRVDSAKSGASGRGIVTTQGLRDEYMSLFRASVENAETWISSQEMLVEMKNVMRDGSWIGAPGGKKDDLVFSGAFAYYAFERQLRSILISRRLIWTPPDAESPGEPAQAAGPTLIVARAVTNYLEQLGIKNADATARIGPRAYNRFGNSSRRRVRHGRAQRIPVSGPRS